jgi:hypothetical protein
MSLKIVPYNPGDYSLSNVLVADAEITHETIGQVLSLYFQFKDGAKAFAVDPIYRGGLDITYDEDERSPSELIIHALPTLVEKLSTEKFMNIHVEVFETLYAFTADILGTYPAESTIVVAVPKTIQRLARRKYPRIEINPENKSLLEFMIENEIIDATHLGINSVEVSSSHAILSDGILRINNFAFAFKVLRQHENVFILGLQFSNGKNFGEYFDLYRKIAYPSLRSRYDFDYESGLKLFQDTGYFGKYNKEENSVALKRITDTFESVKNDTHTAVADYYTVNERGQLVGSSGVALSQLDEQGTPFWVLQHMCALKDPASIENSGVLYSWRAEYLAGRPENLRFIVKFSYDSKWIQRIFHKFIGSTSSNAGSLHNTKTKWVNFKRTSDKNRLRTQQIEMAGQKRYFGSNQDCFVASEPKTLNFAGLLEEVVVLNEHVKEQELRAFVGEFLTANDLEERTLKVCYTSPGNLDNMEGESSPSDGLCIVEKSAMYDFSKSIAHSIAVTKRKLLDAS